jgi:ABC-type transporter Mla MlaB component
MAETQVTLADNLEIAQVQTLGTTLRDALAQAQPVTLDAAAVQRVDGAALQVLAAFVRTAQARGVPVSWQAVPEALTRAAGLLGLKDVLWLAA